MFQILEWKDQVSNSTSLSPLVHDNDYVGNPARTALNQMKLFKKKKKKKPAPDYTPENVSNIANYCMLIRITRRKLS